MTTTTAAEEPMALYRGQRYGEPVGEWWTSSRKEAQDFAMSRGGNRTYVVLMLDEDNEEWLAQFLMFDRSTHNSDSGDWYRIPIDALRARWRGVRILSGAISLESKP